MKHSNMKSIEKKVQKSIAEQIDKGSENVTTISADPSPKYEAPDDLKPESTILED